MYHNEKQYEGNTNVWLTPKNIIDSLGPFDLDPCAADPRPFDIGKVNYTEADDGLSKEWEGFVFCNPPYGPHVGAWLDKLALHSNGIALVFARTDTKAMQRALSTCDMVCFLAKRVTFVEGIPPHNPGKTSGGAPSILIAYGALAVERLYNLNIPTDGLMFIRDDMPFSI